MSAFGGSADIAFAVRNGLLLTRRRHRTAITLDPYPFNQPMPASGLVGRALSTSFIALLPKDEQDFVRAEVESIIEGARLLTVRNIIAFPYVTELHLFEKQG